MMLATYIPFHQEKEEIFCFPADTVERLIKGSFLWKEKMPEMLVLFPMEEENIEKIEESEYFTIYKVKELPENAYYLQIGEVIDAGAFLCDELQREAFPEEQKKKRDLCIRNIKRKLPENALYPEYLMVQLREFTKYLLPIWAPFLLSAFDSQIRDVDLDARISDKDEVILENMITRKEPAAIIDQSISNMLYGWNLKPNDFCYCGSGKKYKKCHGNVNLVTNDVET